jgi:hypothetical protein
MDANPIMAARKKPLFTSPETVYETVPDTVPETADARWVTMPMNYTLTLGADTRSKYRAPLAV